ncbi:MAG: MBL fold metallo-hydrolase [Thermoanaerobaculia bacterium]
MISLLLALLLEVVSGVHVLRGGFVPGSQPDGNTVVFDAPQGWIVVDSGRHAAHTQRIVDFARESKRPIAAIINTHWHLDHISGNAALRTEFPHVRVYASNALEEAQKGFLANYRKQLVEMIAQSEGEQRKRFEDEVARIDAGPKLAPDEVITASGHKTLAGKELTIELEQHAVTAGDLWVYDASTGVVAAGDLVTLPAPFLDTACPERWAQSLERLSKTPFHILIPGHGAPMTHKQFDVYRAAFTDLLACGKSDKPNDACIDGWVAATKPLARNDDEKFTRDLMGYYVNLLRDARHNCGTSSTP